MAMARRHGTLLVDLELHTDLPFLSAASEPISSAQSVPDHARDPLLNLVRASSLPATLSLKFTIPIP